VGRKRRRRGSGAIVTATDSIDVDAKDIYGRMTLSWAAENEHMDVVDLLLEADVESRDDIMRTPVLYARKEFND
jgi:ankyrin repeat protein